MCKLYSKKVSTCDYNIVSSHVKFDEIAPEGSWRNCANYEMKFAKRIEKVLKNKLYNLE